MATAAASCCAGSGQQLQRARHASNWRLHAYYAFTLYTKDIKRNLCKEGTVLPPSRIPVETPCNSRCPFAARFTPSRSSDSARTTNAPSLCVFGRVFIADELYLTAWNGRFKRCCGLVTPAVRSLSYIKSGMNEWSKRLECMELFVVDTNQSSETGVSEWRWASRRPKQHSWHDSVRSVAPPPRYRNETSFTVIWLCPLRARRHRTRFASRVKLVSLSVCARPDGLIIEYHCWTLHWDSLSLKKQNVQCI